MWVFTVELYNQILVCKITPLPNYIYKGYLKFAPSFASKFILVMKSAPSSCVCLACVRDWKHFRNGGQQQVRSGWALKSVLLIDPVHILKIKDSIKGIAKLLKTVHAPKKGIDDSVNKQSRWWLLVWAITPPTPVTAQTHCWRLLFNVWQQCGSGFDWHLSFIRAK